MAIKVATIREMREIEAAADGAVISYAQMMQKAGEAASQFLQRAVAITQSTQITCLIGKGNNGGDGLVMALDLARNTPAQLHLYLLDLRPKDDLNYQAVLDAALPVTLAQDDEKGGMLAALVRESDVIVDALFGIGLSLPLRERAAQLLQIVKSSLGQKAAEDSALSALASIDRARKAAPTRPFVFALDCPSGIDCDRGAADPHTLAADATISFIAAKPGLLTFPAAGYVGELVVSDIGIPASLPALRQLRTAVVDRAFAKSLLPRRPLDGHKGSFGKVMIVAGSPNYIGAIALAGESACRSGVGLVTIASARQQIDSVAGGLREPTWLPLPDEDGAIAEGASETVFQSSRGYQALLVGCGLGLHSGTRAFIARLAESDELPPLILDADALNILSEVPRWWESLRSETIITPHSGEMARLTQLSTTAINADRWETARKYAAEWQVVILLKGAHTIIAAPDGQTAVIPFKSDALGTAGTGDILAGLIAGLRAQGLAAFAAAALGAYVHAAAGVIAAERIGSSRSVIAGDVLNALGDAFQSLELT